MVAPDAGRVVVRHRPVVTDRAGTPAKFDFEPGRCECVKRHHAIVGMTAHAGSEFFARHDAVAGEANVVQCTGLYHEVVEVLAHGYRSKCERVVTRVAVQECEIQLAVHQDQP